MKTTLRGRLMLSFLLAILATTIILVLVANVVTRDRFTYMVSFSGQRTVQRLAPVFTSYYVQVGSWEGVETVMDWYNETRFQGMQDDAPHPMNPRWEKDYRPEVFAEDRLLLLDSNGNIVADSAPEAGQIKLPSGIEEKGALITVDNRHVGALVIVSALGELNVYQSDFLRQVTRLLIAAGVLIGIIGIVVSGIQAKRIVAPVKAISKAAQQIATGDFSQRVPVAGDDELSEMAATFNTMATELERQQELRHRAMADIAHELRTPLSVLQIELESIEDGLSEPTPETIAGLQSEIVHLGRLVEDLRVLSLTDAGELHLDLEPVAVGSLVAGVVERMHRAAAEKGLHLAVKGAESAATVQGDARRLTQVLLNLLANAVQYTPAGGTIIVAIETTGDQNVSITVQDTGVGIAPEHQLHVFERFYRVDAARSTKGSGLGLSIAKSLVQAHGGRIQVTSTVGQGSTFTVSLPLMPAAILPKTPGSA
ncbi:MAG: HAMP domain-containing protein [Anaerolineae bacterium]|nr:HAMP domain-containing protein [Anaerolineae bacterium]